MENKLDPMRLWVGTWGGEDPATPARPTDPTTRKPARPDARLNAGPKTGDDLPAAR